MPYLYCPDEIVVGIRALNASAVMPYLADSDEIPENPLSLNGESGKLIPLETAPTKTPKSCTAGLKLCMSVCGAYAIGERRNPQCN